MRVKAAVNDFLITAAWCAISSLLGCASNHLHKATGVNWDILFLGQLILYLMVFIEISNRMGGALFNPAVSVALCAASQDTYANQGVRLLGQVLGAIVGPYFTWMLTPTWVHDEIVRPAVLDGASLFEGIMCEGLCGFVANLVGLWAEARGGQVGYWGPFAVTCVLVKMGQVYTGPVMNPSYALAWNFYHGTHDEAEHVLVYWVAPFVGSVAAGLAFQATHPKAKKKKL